MQSGKQRVKRVDNYILVQQLNKSLHSQVFLGLDTRTNRNVAIKRLHKAELDRRGELKRSAKCEIELHKKRQVKEAKHIVRSLQIIETANNLYFVYEYCEGGTLEQLLNRSGPIPEAEAVAYIGQLVQAFRVLSGLKVMHRDVKPSNIFLKEGALKIGDFGFSTDYTQESRCTTFMGSPFYMAPEVMCEQEYGPKVDVWSLGVVLFEMLYGSCPYKAESIQELKTLLGEQDLPIVLPSEPSLSHFTRELLLRRMLSKKKDERCDWNYLINLCKDLRPVYTPIIRDAYLRKHGYFISLLKLHAIMQETQWEGRRLCGKLLDNLLALNLNYQKSLQTHVPQCVRQMLEQQERTLRGRGARESRQLHWFQQCLALTGLLRQAQKAQLQKQLRQGWLVLSQQFSAQN